LFYQQWAREIARRNPIGTNVFHAMPLYPYFLAFLDRLAVGNEFLIRLFHLALGSVNCVLVYCIAKKVFERPVALIAALLAVTNFTLIYYDWLMMPVTLLVSLSLLVIYSLLLLDTNSRKREWFTLGLLVGLTALGDGKFLIFFPLLIAYLFINHRTQLKKFTIRILLPLGLGVILMLAGVTIRNKIVADDLVFISSQSGVAFYFGNNPRSSEVFNNPSFIGPSHDGNIRDSEILAQLALKRTLKPSESSAFWRKKAINFITRSKRQYLNLLGRKFFAFFTKTEAAYDIDLLMQKEWKDTLDVNSLRIIIPLAILGIGLALRSHTKTISSFMLIASQLIFTLLFYLMERHRATIVPFLLIFESYALYWVYLQFRQKRMVNLAAAGSILTVLFVALPSQPINPKIVKFIRHTKSGEILAKQEQLKEAQDHYLKALELQPIDTNTLYNLGNAYMKDGNLPDSIKCYRKAVAINPNDVDSLYNMACAIEMTGDRQKSFRIYRRVLMLDPSSIDARFRYAKILKSQGNCNQALKHFDMILRANPIYEDQLVPLINECQK